MERKILVLTDSINPREEVLRYSLGLARRLESVLVVLALLHPEEGPGGRDPDREQRAERSLADRFDGLHEDGEQVEPWVRFGDPVSEVIKFLAGAGSYQAVIWGGEELAAEGRGSHWLYKVKGLVECPLMIPSKKGDRRS